MLPDSKKQERPERPIDLKEKAFVAGPKQHREQLARDELEARLRTAENRTQTDQKSSTATKRKTPPEASKSPALRNAYATDEGARLSDCAYPIRTTTDSGRTDRGLTKRTKTEQGSTVFRAGRQNITNNVYNTFNSYKFITHTRGSLPGYDFVPTLPRNSRFPTTAPANAFTTETTTHHTSTQVEDPKDAEKGSDIVEASSAVHPKSNTFPGLTDGVEYEIEELEDNNVASIGKTIKKPTYSDRCLREARAKRCGRNSCKYVHEDQVDLFANLITTLFPNASKAKAAGF
ncbi:hypothetical protein OPT61_g4337 [Boeremia exigua]|uniref:Uncharacterized protein n=1 Tax=Boeremia exigua TaxID=749465 RepID=A0ACC2IEP2_9PLEO|nr:hypothetical protein OPT61_g4337 [Boeremia exigua]